MTSAASPCIVGEVLFDCFPDGQKVLGGAALNVAWHLQALGMQPSLVSRVGDDPEGREVRDAISAWGMSTEHLQIDPVLRTGHVNVSLADGEPTYDIAHPVAYDAIETPNSPIGGALLYHGSLALRADRTRRSLAAIRAEHAGPVFLDVNLRPPWWQREAVLDDLRAAHWVKLNEHELAELHPGVSPESFLEIYELDGLVLTQGARGARLLTAGGERAEVVPGSRFEVVDAVGAGDAFAAVVICGLLGHWSLRTMADRAQAFASSIVGQRGAIVEDRAFYDSLLQRWK